MLVYRLYSEIYVLLKLGKKLFSLCGWKEIISITLFAAPVFSFVLWSLSVRVKTIPINVMRPERKRAGSREDYTVKEAQAPSTPPNGSTRYTFAPRAVRCSKNGESFKIK
jgi:hypothetical protein